MAFTRMRGLLVLDTFWLVGGAGLFTLWFTFFLVLFAVYCSALLFVFLWHLELIDTIFIT